MIRDGGSANFSFALDEIKIFDGSCQSHTTIIPNITITSQPISITEIDSTLSTDEYDVTTSKTSTEKNTMSDIVTTNSTISTTLVSITEITTIQRQRQQQQYVQLRSTFNKELTN
ncbi:unnamed protein product [Rotaria sordida]|uniref:Uncharacterized protein n=1 Tax=Rotaria sordida TaxID=392033 RepID=A0A818RZ72_9BILA|nr:unnamed protein product [Rotaria sordida]